MYWITIVFSADKHKPVLIIIAKKFILHVIRINLDQVNIINIWRMFEFDQLVVLQMNFSSMPHDILDAKTPSKKRKIVIQYMANFICLMFHVKYMANIIISFMWINSYIEQDISWNISMFDIQIKINTPRK